MNKLLNHSLLGAFMCSVVSLPAFAVDSVNITLNNSNSQWLVSHICTTNDFTDEDHCSKFSPASNEATITTTVNLGSERSNLLVRFVKDSKNATTISTVEATLVPNGSYTLNLKDNGELSLQ